MCLTTMDRANVLRRLAMSLWQAVVAISASLQHVATKLGQKTWTRDRVKMVDDKPIAYETAAEVTARSVAVIHHWQQTFPAGKTVSVKHRFFPEGAFIYSFRDNPGLEGQLAHDYCVGPILARALKRSDWGNIFQVHYILRTGANWQGPIGQFTLRIQKETSTQKASVCLDGLRKVDARTFVLRRKGFVPTSDLQIAFIDPA
jgi:hypothetical protein